MIRQLSLICALALAASTPAWANPMTSNVMRLRQVPGHTHVQVTFGVDTQVETLHEPLEIKRDGQLLSATWKPYASFTANTGSGLTNLDSTQFCDCDVKAGSHTYALKLKRIINGKEQIFTRSAKITVNKNTGPQKDLGAMDARVLDGEVLPWNIPEPSKIQGLNCAKICSGGVVVKDGGGGSLDGGTGGGEPGIERGCSYGGTGAAGLPGIMLILALLGLCQIRPKRS